MRRGDIEIRMRGHRLADLDGDRLAEFVVAVARVLDGARLVAVKPTHLVFRPRPPQPEVSCASNT